jgi:two-component system, cell cycle sensor histidine kinase and response regulator CckA
MISFPDDAAAAPAPFPALAWAAALGAAAASSALLYSALPVPSAAVGLFAGLIGLGTILFLLGRRPAPASTRLIREDVALLRAAIDQAHEPIVVTDGVGSMLCANAAFIQHFGAEASLALLIGGEDGASLQELTSAALRDGSAAGEIEVDGAAYGLQVEPAGQASRRLLWKLAPAAHLDLVAETRALVAGKGGRQFDEAGAMIAIVDPNGVILSSNGSFAARAMPEKKGNAEGRNFVDLLRIDEDDTIFFASEARGGMPLRLVQVPLSDDHRPFIMFILLDETAAGLGRLSPEEGAGINNLLDVLPLGLALVDVDGRFLHLNPAFRRATGVAGDVRPAYPGDLVIDEDKGPLSDAVRRYARGPAASSDIPLQLRACPDETVPVTIGSVRGLGHAAVILSMKDSSEEDRLKRQVAQAIKMQAVGQLAGGVAHDFNNILTAIIGHCDLMLMRHSPGDIDYDDIQQIRGNSNRAASLTRQLLAFSRQQTLRPQVLQLPDVVTEVSTLLKRLLDETVTLEVKHGRALGAVRADPGQLEQVIVNLAVNGRDAMPEGGTLTIETYSVSADDVRLLGNDIMPPGEYTALRVTDTGTGIPANLLGKIFEPFFTTKEVGKGTGLGLSTVYGIVKQSGGFIFADSEEGRGASFAVYLPVHRGGEAQAPKPQTRTPVGELWGNATVLLVEDEPMVRAVAERALSRHGYLVLTAEHGAEALEVLEREQGVDLMISDVMMPEMDGPSLVRKARETYPDLPILFISGYAEEQLRKSIDINHVAFLAKPFSVQALAQAVRDVLEAK